MQLGNFMQMEKPKVEMGMLDRIPGIRHEFPVSLVRMKL